MASCSSRSARGRELQPGSRTVDVDTYQARTVSSWRGAVARASFQIMGPPGRWPDAMSSVHQHIQRRKGGELHAYSTLAGRWQPVVGRVAGLVSVRLRLPRGGCLDNPCAW